MICIYIDTHTSTYRVYMCMYVCMSVCLYVCMSVCIHFSFAWFRPRMSVVFYWVHLWTPGASPSFQCWGHVQLGEYTQASLSPLPKWNQPRKSRDLMSEDQGISPPSNPPWGYHCPQWMGFSRRWRQRRRPTIQRPGRRPHFRGGFILWVWKWGTPWDTPKMANIFLGGRMMVKPMGWIGLCSDRATFYSNDHGWKGMMFLDV